MTFYNPFLQLNLSSAFNIGNYMGNCLSQTVFGNLWGQNTCFMPSVSVFMPYANNTPMMPVMNGFDTFSFNGGSVFGNLGMWNNFGGFAFSMPSANTSKPKKNVGNTANIEWWKKQGYNENKAEKLAETSSEYTHYDASASGNNKHIDKAKKKSPDKFTHRCATYVGLAIRDSGLGAYPYAHGYQMAGKLRDNSNFKEISPDGVDLKNLPAGCVLCYNKGSQGYSDDYGHVEISQPNGTATSDGTTHNIRKPDAIFIPV